MEEILASIRKIIADDDPAPKAAAPQARPAPAREPEPEPDAQGQDDIDAILAGLESPAPPAPTPPPAQTDVLELTEEMAAPDTGFGEIEFVDPPQPSAWASEPPASAPPPPLVEPRVAEPLISAQTNSAILAAFGNLNHTILSKNARTLDDLVQDMLRPMLKHWLDDNLPTIVERLVRAEIERVSRAPR
jgi:cell pole-organizing protein PopZ